MKRVFGFILFWFALGMTSMLFIRSALFALFLIVLCLILSYQLFCK